jgi:protein-S-isoprenylcysteine O-methyltransferase Ste14
MDRETIVGATAIVAAMLLYGSLHSILASGRIKRWSEQRFGRNHDRYYRLVFNALGGLTFLPVLAVVARFPGERLYVIRPPWLWLTGAVQLAGVGLLLAGLHQTGAARFLGLAQLVDPASAQSEFTVGGPYRWVRHPLYTAGLLFIWAVPLMTTGVLVLNAGITVYLYVGSAFEERKLVRRFGPAYQRYRRQIPRMIPIPWKRVRTHEQA